jgi:hypothetical protein
MNKKMRLVLFVWSMYRQKLQKLQENRRQTDINNYKHVYILKAT